MDNVNEVDVYRDRLYMLQDLKDIEDRLLDWDNDVGRYRSVCIRGVFYSCDDIFGKGYDKVRDDGVKRLLKIRERLIAENLDILN